MKNNQFNRAIKLPNKLSGKVPKYRNKNVVQTRRDLDKVKNANVIRDFLEKGKLPEKSVSCRTNHATEPFNYEYSYKMLSGIEEFVEVNGADKLVDFFCGRIKECPNNKSQSPNKKDIPKIHQLLSVFNISKIRDFLEKNDLTQSFLYTRFYVFFVICELVLEREIIPEVDEIPQILEQKEIRELFDKSSFKTTHSWKYNFSKEFFYMQRYFFPQDDSDIFFRDIFFKGEKVKTELTDEVRDWIFYNMIVPHFVKKESMQERPLAVILGGQPGSGKSRLDKYILKENPDIEFLVIDCDALKEFHPLYFVEMTKNDTEGSSMVHKESLNWAKRLISYGIDKKCNIIIDQTLRTYAGIQPIIADLRRNNYRIEVRVLALNEQFSSLGIQLRYQTQKQRMSVGFAMNSSCHIGRWVYREIHDNAYKGLTDTVEEIEQKKCVDRIIIYGQKDKEFDIFASIRYLKGMDKFLSALGNGYEDKFDVLYEGVLEGDIWSETRKVRGVIETERGRKWEISESEYHSWMLLWSIVTSEQNIRDTYNEAPPNLSNRLQLLLKHVELLSNWQTRINKLIENDKIKMGLLVMEREKLDEILRLRTEKILLLEENLNIRKSRLTTKTIIRVYNGINQIFGNAQVNEIDELDIHQEEQKIKEYETEIQKEKQEIEEIKQKIKKLDKEIEDIKDSIKLKEKVLEINEQKIRDTDKHIEEIIKMDKDRVLEIEKELQEKRKEAQELRRQAREEIARAKISMTL